MIATELGELEAFRSLIGGWNGGRVTEIGGALCTTVPAAPGSALLNRVVGLGLAEPASEEVLDELDAFFAGDGVAYGITVTPDVELGMAGTLPDFLGRGAQTALLAARIAAAREAGCSGVVTETGEPVEGRPSNSYRNIVRAGFEPVYVRQNYLSSAEADTSGTRA